MCVSDLAVMSLVDQHHPSSVAELATCPDPLPVIDKQLLAGSSSGQGYLLLTSSYQSINQCSLFRNIPSIYKLCYHTVMR